MRTVRTIVPLLMITIAGAIASLAIPVHADERQAVTNDLLISDHALSEASAKRELAMLAVADFMSGEAQKPVYLRDQDGTGVRSALLLLDGASAPDTASPTLAATSSPPMNPQMLTLLLTQLLSLLGIYLKRTNVLDHWIHRPWANGASALVAGLAGAIAQTITSKGLNWFVLVNAGLSFLTMAMATAKTDASDAPSTLASK